MSYILPTFSGEFGNLVRDPDPIGTLANGQRIRLTRVDASAVVFDKLGAEPADDEAETVLAGACGVAGGVFADLDAVIAAIETPPAEKVLSAKEAEDLLDAILDGWAKDWGYTTAARCITYAGDPDPNFDAEGVAMRNARSALWVAVRSAAASPDSPPYTEANVRAFADQFKPVRPSA